MELINVAQTTMFGCFIGACFGGFVKSRDAYVYFIESNQASVFSSTFDAKASKTDHILTYNFFSNLPLSINKDLLEEMLDI